MQKGKTASSEPTTLGAVGHISIKDMFRLKMPCANCPFRKEGALLMEWSPPISCATVGR